MALATIRIAAAMGPDGEHIGFIGVAHDVTASKEAEHELTELNETLERRIEDRTRQLAATEALIQTFFNHSSECHAVIVEASEGRFDTRRPIRRLCGFMGRRESK